MEPARAACHSATPGGSVCGASRPGSSNCVNAKDPRDPMMSWAGESAKGLEGPQSPAAAEGRSRRRAATMPVARRVGAPSAAAATPAAAAWGAPSTTLVRPMPRLHHSVDPCCHAYDATSEDPRGHRVAAGCSVGCLVRPARSATRGPAAAVRARAVCVPSHRRSTACAAPGRRCGDPSKSNAVFCMVSRSGGTHREIRRIGPGRPAR